MQQLRSDRTARELPMITRVPRDTIPTVLLRDEFPRQIIINTLTAAAVARDRAVETASG